MAFKRKHQAESRDFQDLGFGTKVGAGGQRFINTDGTFNVERKGLSLPQRLNLYHSLITISWTRFNLLVVAAYVAVNGLFSLGYLAIGVEQLDGAKGTDWAGRFADAFFFSAQTLTTVGYGHVSPTGLAASFLAAFESMAGVLGFALATGLLYGRFSRPRAKILFSRAAVVAPYRGGAGFIFRIVNGRRNQLIEVEVQVSVTLIETTDGRAERRFYELALERRQINFFPLNWDIVHPIDARSPLFGMAGRGDLEQAEAEFMVLVKGFDDTFAQTVHARFSYRAPEVIWGARFERMLERAPDGAVALDFSKLHAVAPAELPGPGA